MRSAGRDALADLPPELPLVIVEKVKGASRLAAVSRKARQAGLMPGITLADARARLPGLWVEEMNRAADAALLDAMAEDCERASPIVMIDPPDGLTLDITGCAHLFGGEAELRRLLSQRFRRAGLSVRTVVAGAADTARALARFGRTAIVPAGGEEAAVRPLPIAALGLEEKDRVAISRAGLKTIGALIDRPGQIFSARFGEAMTRRLRRLSGAEDALLVPRRNAPMLWVERRFAEPIGRMEDIEATLVELAQEAGDQLFARREGGRVFEASFYRADGAVRRIMVETGRPMRQPDVLLRLFREKLDALADPIDPGFGFDLVRLAILHAERLDPVQSGLDGHAVERDAVADLADRLGARFGVDRVVRFLAEDSHDPDRAAQAVPAALMSAASAAFNPMTSAVWPTPGLDEPPLRPARLFDPPQVIDITMAEVPDGPPRGFRWRRVDHRIVAHEGPERIAPEWWRTTEEAKGQASAEVRDYYRVEDAEGRRFWLFRAGAYGEKQAPRWFLHGVFA